MNIRDILTTPNGSIGRIVHMTLSSVWVMDLSPEYHGWPVEYENINLITARSEDEQSPKKRPNSTAAYDYCTTAAMRFGEAFANTERLLTSRGRAQVYKELKASDSTLSSSTFYKTLRRYFENGGLFFEITPEWRNPCSGINLEEAKALHYQTAAQSSRDQAARILNGGNNLKIDPFTKKNGEPRAKPAPVEPTLYRVDEPTIRVFHYFYEKHRASPGTSLKALYQQMRDEVFSLPQPTGTSILFPIWAIPSYDTFRGWYTKVVPFDKRRASKRGKRHYLLSERPRDGDGHSRANAAGVVGELDATIWPIDLVGEGPDAPLIGPPVVFRIRCKDTGQLLGIGTSLENASWEGAASAIANCVTDKQQFCAEHDLEIPSWLWNVRGLPTTIVADCGETYNNKPTRFMLETSTNIRNIQKGRGDYKPGVESDWHVLQTKLNGKAPGAIIKEYETASGKPWRSKAAMTLNQFYSVLIAAELRRMIEPKNLKGWKEAEILKGVDDSYASQWMSTEYIGGLRSISEDVVRRSLLCVEKGAITPEGLLFRGLIYSINSEQARNAQQKARRSGNTKVDVGFDSRSVDNIYILNESKKGQHFEYALACLNLTRQDMRTFAGKTFREVAQLQRALKENNRNKLEIISNLDRSLAQQQSQIYKIAEHRVTEARKTHVTTESALEKEKPAAREREKNRTSPAQALTAQPTPAPTPPQIISSPIPAPAPHPSKGMAARAALLKG